MEYLDLTLAPAVESENANGNCNGVTTNILWLCWEYLNSFQDYHHPAAI